MQPPLDALAHDLPGLAGPGVTGQVGEAAVKLGDLHALGVSNTLPVVNGDETPHRLSLSAEDQRTAT